MSVLSELEKKISSTGEKSPELTPIEINRLIQTQIDAHSPEFVLFLLEGFKQGKIDASIALLQMIAFLRKKEQLFLLALALRYGANPNMYVNAEKIGTIHLLAYTAVIMFRNKIAPSIINGALALLIMLGSKAVLPIYDPSGGKARDTNLYINSKYISTREWLTQQGYQTIISQETSLENILDAESYERLAIMLDREELLHERKLNLSHQDLVIQCFAQTFYPKLQLTYTDNYFNSIVMSSSIGYYNFESFVSCLNKGEIVCYSTITVLILKLRAHLEEIFSYLVLERMLVEIIARGTRIDREQYNMLSSLRPSTLEQVAQTYGQPFWKKVCANMNDVISPDLRELAIGLGLDFHSDKESICTEITELQKLDSAEKYNQAIMRREELRMAATLGQPEDFLDGKIPTFQCRNKAVLSYNPTEINALDIAYFRDVHGAVWCIPSSSFDEILQRKINPYTSETLPTDFLIEVKAKRDTLEELGLKPGNREVMTYPQAIKKIETIDTISNDFSEKVLAGFIQMCIVNGVPEMRVRNLNPAEITQILRGQQIFVDLTTVTGLESLFFLAYTVRELSRRGSSVAVALIRSIH